MLKLKKKIDVSSRALEYLEMIVRSSDQPDGGLLLMLKQEGCAGYSYDLKLVQLKEIEKTENFVLVHEGTVSIYVERFVGPFLFGTVVDFLETAVSTGLVFNNPNVTAACGCGSSVAFSRN